MSYALAALSGVLAWLSFPTVLSLHFEAWPAYVAYFAWVPLCVAVWDKGWKHGLKFGFISGLIFFVLGLSWITNVKPMGLASFPAWWALSAWCALFVALWAALAGLAGRLKFPLIFLAAAWTILEFLRERLLTGFPWMNLGSSQAFNPAVLPLAAVTGQAGLHFLVVLGNLCAFALFWKQDLLLGWRRSLSTLLCFALLATGIWTGRSKPLADQDRLSVAIVQGGIDQDQAWDKAYRERLMGVYLGLSEAAIGQGAKLLLWPESSFPGFFNDDAEEARLMKAFAKKNSVHLVIGSTLSERGSYQNAALWIDAAGNTQSYAKRHLVPFGEYLPFRSAVPLLDQGLKRLGLVDFEAGLEAKRFGIEGFQAVPLVCYESVFPQAARAAGPADLLLILTVDTWYGDSAGPVWHASQAVLRAVENDCWVARSAATGISLFASPQGKLTESLPLGSAGFRVAQIHRAQVTFYQAYGEWFSGLCLLLLVILGSNFLQRSSKKLVV